MAISAVTSTANTTATTTSANFTMTSPTGTTTGDLLVCVIGEHGTSPASDGVTAIADTATGTRTFTNLTFVSGANNDSLSIWYRVVQSGDPTGAGGWTATSAVQTEAALMAYRGVDNTTSIDAQGTSNTAVSGLATFHAVTTVTAGAWYLGVVSTDRNTANLGALQSGSPTPTERADAGNGGNINQRAQVALIDAVEGAAGSTGQFVYTLTTSAGWNTYSLALRPAPTGTNFSQTLSASATPAGATALATGYGLDAALTEAGALDAAQSASPAGAWNERLRANAVYRI